ncbi:MAG: hypothetical protein CM1200mP25_0410 [Acidobacteriota bacterium]|nr:MAG: hypothetical protein CM1200mP25_0410 [Acidobacteriota bacterium]
MTWWERWGFNTFHVVVGVTGFVYFYMNLHDGTNDPFEICEPSLEIIDVFPYTF